VRDPRAQVLAGAAATIAADGDGTALLDLARSVETTATRLLDEAKPGRSLRANAEYSTAVLLHQLGVTPDLFTPVFAVSRMAGWIAHCLEQRRVDRIFRPTSVYEGPPPRAWVPEQVREACA
jgi:citrate synthase